jgi:site-specific DNA-cytosine methylase
MTRLVSLFAGVGGFDLAFEQAGFQTVGQVEIDEWCQKVLTRQWPDVPKHRDITTAHGMIFGPAEVVTFGSPCQDLSVAGKRAGLEGERSGLFMEAMRFIREMREGTSGEYPKYALWENVPGALNSNAGRDFAVVLGQLAKLGALDISWRVLDSRHFGVAQRRRRVFLVADFGGERAAQILFEPEGVRRDTQEGGSEGQDVAACLTTGVGQRYDAETETLIPIPYTASSFGAYREGRGTLRAEGGGFGDGSETILLEPLAVSENQRAELRLTPYVRSISNGGGKPRQGYPAVMEPLAFDAKASVSRSMNPSHLSPALEAQDKVAVAFALRGREGGAQVEVSGDAVNTLRGAEGGSSRDYVALAQPLKPQGVSDIIAHANAEKTHTGEILRSLREEVGAQAFEEWALGVVTAFRQAPILRPGVYEAGLPSQAESRSGERSSREVSSAAVDTSRTMLEVWDAQCARRSPQGRKPLEQRPKQLRAYLSLLSQQDSPRQRFLLNLRQASEGSRLLRHALSEVQEVRRSADDQDTAPQSLFGAGLRSTGERSKSVRQTLHAKEEDRNATSSVRGGDVSRSELPTYAVRRLTPRSFRECERLQAFPDGWTKYTPEGKEIPDTHRYRMCGNAVTVSTVRWIAERILAAHHAGR